MKNVSYSEKFVASNVSDSIVNTFYLVLTVDQNESCLLFTRYSGYILPYDVTFIQDSVYKKLLKSVHF